MAPLASNQIIGEALLISGHLLVESLPSRVSGLKIDAWETRDKNRTRKGLKIEQRSTVLILRYAHQVIKSK